MNRKTKNDGSQNRYLLIAVIAVVAVASLYILKTNMEAPPEQAESMSPAQQMAEEGGMGDLMSQIEHIRQMIGDDSTNFDALATLGNMYYDADMPAEAIVWYKKALRIDPESLPVLTDMSTMYRALERSDTAVVILERVVAIDPSWQQGWFNLGVIYNFDLGQQREALDAWKKFVALNPNAEQAASVQREIERLEKELDG